MASRVDILPTEWRATVRRLLFGAEIYPSKRPGDKRPRPVFSPGRLSQSYDPKLLVHAAQGDKFLKPDISGVHEAQRYIAKLPEISKEAERILSSTHAEDAARLLVQACLNTRKGIAAADGRSSEGRIGLAIAAISMEIGFIAEKIVLDPGSPRPRLKTKAAEKVGKAIDLLLRQEPRILVQDVDTVQLFRNYYDPPKDYRWKTLLPHGKPGRPRLSINTIVVSLIEANMRLCGQKVYRAAGSLLVASSSKDVPWRAHDSKTWGETIRNAYENTRNPHTAKYSSPTPE